MCKLELNRKLMANHSHTVQHRSDIYVNSDSFAFRSNPPVLVSWTRYSVLLKLEFLFGSLFMVEGTPRDLGR
jgi:hypothetical protein